MMLDVIDKYYDLSSKALKYNIAYNEFYDSTLLNDISQMKYNVENDKIDKLNELSRKIENHFARIRG